jgi:hypothetical protein
MLNDLGLKSTIHKRHYMMLWPNPRNASHAIRVSIVYLLSTLELLRGRRKKACFVLERERGGTPKAWRRGPVAIWIFRSIHRNFPEFSGICFQKISEFLRQCVRIGARMALRAIFLFRRGAVADSVRSGYGGDSGAKAGLLIIPAVDPEDDHTW